MRKINLLYVITKLELGGAQKQLLSLLRLLDKDGFRLFLFTAKEGLILPDALSINGLTVVKSTYLERPINPLKDALALIEIYSFIKKNNIKIVHTHSSKAGILGRLAARLAGAEIIVHTVHGWSFNDYQPKLKRLFFIRLERFVAGFTDKLIVVSDYDRKTGINNRIGSEGKYALIRYGIDYSQFDGASGDLHGELGIGGGEVAVGMIACFKPQKSPLDFVKLAGSFKDVCGLKFVLVGDGILRAKIQKLITQLKLENRFIVTGWRKDIPEILSTIDILVLTSLWEGLPITVLEAMASSKPVLVTDTGAVAEVVVDGKTGFLAGCRDIKALSRKLRGLLEDENLRKEIGDAGKRSLGEDFLLSKMVEKTGNLYLQCINSKQPVESKNG